MKILISICFIGFMTRVYCQEPETFLPDSIYFKNKVKTSRSSFVGQPSKAAIIINYDRMGRKVKYTLTGNESGEGSQMDINYIYNSNGQIASETTIFYDDSTIQKTFYYYDKDKRISRKVTKIGKFVIEIESMLYIPKRVSNTVFFNEKGEIYRRDTAYFTNGSVYDNYRGYEIRDGSRHNWNYHLKASYDSVGRIISNVYITNGKEGDGDFYFYDEKGLLIKLQSGTPGAWIIKKFDYTFWE